MSQFFERNKNSWAQIAFLVMLAIGIMAGYLLVRVRSRVKLGEPVKLDFAGLSVSLPHGRGWTENPQWQYRQENTFDISTAFDVGVGISAVVRCSYILASENIDPSEKLQKLITSMDAKIVDSSQILTTVKIEWAKIITKGGVDNVYVGVAQLTDSRTLELEVLAPTEPKMAETIFHDVIAGISVSPDLYLEKGGRFIQKLKSIGLKKLISPQSDDMSEKVFIVDETEDTSQGFMIDGFSPSSSKEGWLQVKRQCLQYTPGNKIKAGICFMQCDDTFDNFIWQGKNSCTGVRRKGLFRAELTDGRMEVSNMISAEDKIYWLSQAAIPSTLLDMAAGNFLDFDEDRIIVDAIFPGGIIVPTRISKISNAPETSPDLENSISVKLDFLYSKEHYQQLYFDENRRVIKRIEQNDEKLNWQISDRQTVMDKFSGWEEHFGRLLD